MGKWMLLTDENGNVVAVDGTLKAAKALLVGDPATDLSSIRGQTDKLQFDASNFLKTAPQQTPNPSNLDVALSTRASETTLDAVKTLVDALQDALASVGADKLRVSLVDSLPAGANVIGGVRLRGYDYANATWRDLRVDADGKVVVTI